MSFSSQAEPSNTKLTVLFSSGNTSEFFPFPFLPAPFLFLRLLCGISARERQSLQSWPGRPSSKHFVALSSVSMLLEVATVRVLTVCVTPGVVLSSLMASLAAVKPLKAWTGYSKIVHNSSTSRLNVLSRSMTYTVTFWSISETSRATILRKPRKSSFCSSRSSSPASKLCCATFNLLDTMSINTFCCFSSPCCHSFCVRRHFDLKAMRTWPGPAPLMLTIWACTISFSWVSEPKTASKAEWYDMPASETVSNLPFPLLPKSCGRLKSIVMSVPSSANLPVGPPMTSCPKEWRKSKKEGLAIAISPPLPFDTFVM
mmetsp:Transcript_36266/g.104176  ORF Transcript_36266/g.104176 Transcript_36266/m.104176 type:complete len:315 (+) Transcript_36266:312-1256(+)